MSRYRASLIHLLISALLVSNVVAIVYFAWYPKPAFDVAGALSIIGMLVGVDLVLGPILTLIVYQHGKPGLRFDLSVIAAVQLVALVYGSFVLYTERPVYVVFAIDRVEFVSSKQIDESAIRYGELKDKRLARLTEVFARVPEDPQEYQRFFDGIMFEGQPDLQLRSEYWEPWESGGDLIRQRIRNLDDIVALTADEQQALQDAVASYGDAHQHLGIIPVGGTEKDIGLLVDRDSLEILDALAVNPWPSSAASTM